MTFFFSLYIVADCDHSAAVDAAETRVYSSSVPDGFPRLTSWGGQYIYCQPAFWFIGALVYLMMPDFFFLNHNLGSCKIVVSLCT